MQHCKEIPIFPQLPSNFQPALVAQTRLLSLVNQDKLSSKFPPRTLHMKQ